ncbi:GNAT family N-acetyltransferase [Pseudoflavitalea sp. G-6-1-2]|uniref:GNAT family N-acetyltransferase n=1 Tax=Pseudoflavitalea sp. G-6-1-2 TaxID=2728841 RepID=UPI00146C8E34|nr:GNAT family N-acetyltransferase [Pseudoflavitalea sp. G-6-1-2]NML23581.1 GNAT family N-acetyltransferase [Pseudoflavitalea sp. G-6-1-2]
MQITVTPRLVIRELVLEDAPFVLSILNTPGWIRFIGDRKVHDLAAAEQYIDTRFIYSYNTYGYGIYAIESSEGKLLGLCGLVKRDYLPHPDLGYALMPENEGQGYAREAAAAVLRYAVETLGQKVIHAIVTPTNSRSVHLLEQLGFSFEKDIMDTGERLLLFSYHANGSAEQ